MLPSLAEILRPPHDVLTDLERTYLERARAAGYYPAADEEGAP